MGASAVLEVMRIVKGFTILFLAALLSFGGCSVWDQLTGQEDDNNNGILLVLAALAARSSGCQNNSGLVICIPPGLRQ